MLTRPLVSVCALVASLAAQSIPGAWVSPTASGGPVPMVNGAMGATFDSLRHESVLVYWNGTVNSVFTWDGALWTSHGTVGWWGATSAMAYDPVRDRTVLLTETNNVWEWDRTTWYWGGPAPMTAWTRPLVWDVSQQRVLSMDSQGLWRWDGAAWSLMPGSAPPPQASQYQGVSLARDDARNVLVATYIVGPHTLEWNGASWQSWLTGSTDFLEIVYAPSLGGVVGYRGNHYDQNVSDTLRWDPAVHQWISLPVGGSPGVHFDIALAYDSHRARPVLFAIGNAFSGLWEYDFAATYAPRTWIVGSVWWLATGNDALRYASNTDRIVLLSGPVSLSGPLIEGLRIECGPGVAVGPLHAYLPAGQSLSLTGGTWQAVSVGNADEVRMHGCTFTCMTWIFAGFTHLTDCVFGPATGACSLPSYPAPALALSGPAVVDSCVATGQPGYYTTFPYTVYPSAPAIAVDNGAPLWVVHSTLAGGSSATVGTAAPLAVGTGSATVVGASTLTGSGTPPPSMRFSADTTWNGLPPPAALTIPSLSWLASAVTAPVGGTLSITSTLQPLDIVFLFFDTRMLFLPAPGFALPLQLDPTSAFLAGVLTQGTPSYSLLVPSQPSLTGLATHWQGIAVGAQFALTNARTILLR